MSARTYGPPRRKNPVGAPPPKWWGRQARHRFAIRVPVADSARHAIARGTSCTAGTPGTSSGSPCGSSASVA